MALSSPPTAPRALVLGVVAGLVLLTAFVLALLFWDDMLPAGRAEIAHDADDETAQIAAARTAVVATAPDADAVTFGKISVDWIGEAPAVCGRVAIDEPQDSLDGEEQFVFIDGELTLESRDGSAAVQQKWKDVCDDA